LRGDRSAILIEPLDSFSPLNLISTIPKSTNARARDKGIFPSDGIFGTYRENYLLRSDELFRGDIPNHF
jgi:hypothetical protein